MVCVKDGRARAQLRAPLLGRGELWNTCAPMENAAGTEGEGKTQPVLQRPASEETEPPVRRKE